MKNTMNFTLIFALIFVMMSSLTFAQKPDKEAVKATLLNYIEGGTLGDTTRLCSAFHPSASMKYLDNKTKEYKDIPIKEFLDRAKQGAGNKVERKGKIAYLDVQGTVAQAKVELVYDTFKFIDFFNLLKINGEWKIVSKIFYREEKVKQ
jgi:hypothetical protein